MQYWSRSLLYLALVYVCTVSVSDPASAMAEPISVDSSLVSTIAQTDLIVRGEVIDAKARWLSDHSAIVTDSRIRPIYAVMGDVTQPILVTVPGGIIEDETIAMIQSRDRPLQPGQQVLLFLRNVDPSEANLTDVSGNYRLTAGASSHYVVSGDTARNASTFATQSLGELYALIEQIALSQGKSFALTPDWRVHESTVSAANVLAPVDFVDNGQRWPGDNPVIDYYVNINTLQAGSEDGTGAEFLANIEDAAYTWSRVGTASIALRFLGSTDTTATGINARNEILFSHTLSEGVLGLARVWYNPSTNIILEADMAINDNYDWDTTGSPDWQEVDLQSVVLHEMGHWLPLGHDDEQHSVMFSTLTTGTIQRELHENDIEGASTLYPCSSVPCIHEWVPMPPTQTPTVVPTLPPTSAPTMTPTTAPTQPPTPIPTLPPTAIPTQPPTVVPTLLPTALPPSLPTPLPTPLSPSPDEQSDATEITIKPDEATALSFGDNTEFINVELALPPYAVSEPTTIEYEAVDTLPLPPGSDYVFSGYGFALYASQQGEGVVDFSFNRSVVLDVYYDDAHMSDDEERRLVLHALNAGQWQPAGCGSPVHSPQADRISAPICELSHFALLVEKANVESPLLPNQLFVPMVRH